MINIIVEILGDLFLICIGCIIGSVLGYNYCRKIIQKIAENETDKATINRIFGIPN